MINWDLIEDDVVVIAKYNDDLSGSKCITQFTIDIIGWLHSKNVNCFIEQCVIIAVRPSASIDVASAINKRLYAVMNEDR